MTNSMQRKAKASDAYVREILAAQRKLGSDKLPRSVGDSLL